MNLNLKGRDCTVPKEITLCCHAALSATSRNPPGQCRAGQERAFSCEMLTVLLASLEYQAVISEQK